MTNEIRELEKTLDESKQEKNQLLISKMDGDQDDERQNLVRQLTQEKVKRIFSFSFQLFLLHFQGSI